MAMKDRVVELVLKARNLISKDTDKAADSVDKLAGGAEALQKKLGDLENQGRLITNFEKASKAVDRTAAAYDRAQLRLARLNEKIGESGPTTARQARELAAAERAAERTSRAYKSAEAGLKGLAKEAQTAGIDVTNLSGAQRANRKQIEAAEQALEKYNREQEEANAKIASLRGSLASGTKAFVRWAAAAAAAGAALGAAVLTRLTTSQADLARQTLASARAFDVSAQSLQKWQVAAEEVGIGGEKTSDILKDVSEKIGDAFRTGGGEAAEVIASLNLSLDELVQLRPDEQLLAIAGALDDLPKPGQVQVLEALASDASLLLPLLENNAQRLRELGDAAQARGAILTDEELQILAAADSAMQRLKDRFAGFTNDLAVRVAPAFTTLAERIDTALGNKPELVERLGEAFSRLVQRAERWAVAALNGSEEVLRRFGDLARVVGGLGSAVAAASGELIFLAKAWIGLRIAGMIRDATLLGQALLGGVAAGGSAAATAFIRIAQAVRGLAWASLISAVLETARAIGTLRAAQDDLADSRRASAAVEAEAIQRIQQFREQTGLAASSLDDLIAAQEAGTAIWDAANERWIVGAEAIAAYQQAAKSAATSLEDDLGEAASTVVAKLDRLKQSGQDAETALASVFAGYDLRATEDVGQLLEDLEILRRDAGLTAEVIDRTLAQALGDLTADELRAFQINAKLAFAEGRIAAGEFAEAIGGTVRAALQRLGVDVTKVETGISAVGTEAIDAFQLVRNSIAETGVDSEQAAKKVSAAFLAAFAKVETEAGRKELLAGLRQAVSAGIIDLATFNGLLGKVGLTATGTEKNLDGVGESADRAADAIRRMKEESEEAGEEVEEAGTSGGAAYEIMTKAIAGFTAQMEQLSQRAVSAWQVMVAGPKAAISEMDPLKTRLAEVQARITELGREGFRVFDATGLRGKLIDMGIAARTVEKRFLEQKIALQELARQYEDGEIKADFFVQRMEQAVRASDLLNDQDLDQFQGAIEAARREMASLRDTTLDTVNSLQDELDRLQGNTAAIEQRQFQQRIRELEDQLQYAEAVGDQESIRNARKALDLARDIKAVKDQENQAAAAERAARERDRQREQSGFGARQQPRSTVSTRAPATASGSTTTINLQLGGQNIGSLSGVDESEARQLVDALERAGLTVAGAA